MLDEVRAGPQGLPTAGVGPASLLCLAQDELLHVFQTGRAPATLAPFFAPPGSSAAASAERARAAVYHARTHPELAECLDRAAGDAWAVSDAFERAVTAWQGTPSPQTRARRARHACAVARAFAGASPDKGVLGEHAPMLAQLRRRAGALAQGPVSGLRVFAGAWLAALVGARWPQGAELPGVRARDVRDLGDLLPFLLHLGEVHTAGALLQSLEQEDDDGWTRVFHILARGFAPCGCEDARVAVLAMAWTPRVLPFLLSERLPGEARQRLVLAAVHAAEALHPWNDPAGRRDIVAHPTNLRATIDSTRPPRCPLPSRR